MQKVSAISDENFDRPPFTEQKKNLVDHILTHPHIYGNYSKVGLSFPKLWNNNNI